MVGTIYLLKRDDDAYIGSTMKSLDTRYEQHMYSYDKPKLRCYNKPLYKRMRECPNDWTISVLEKFEDITRTELLQREGQAIRELKPNLNKQIPGRTQKDYYNENKDVLYQKHRDYIAHNIERRKAYQRDWRLQRMKAKATPK